MVRAPYVAGKFYPGDAASLEKEVRKYLPQKADKVDAYGCVSPHAGYMYSGRVAGEVLAGIKPKKTYVIIGPNHSGRGEAFGLDMRNWLTPLGKVEIDKELGEELLGASEMLVEDEMSHNMEHSLEVQLPFLQVLQREFKFVPIVIGGGGIDEFRQLGREISKAIKKTGKGVTVIASSDMTHYEPHEAAKIKDRFAIDRILEMDVDGFLEEVERRDISMCGYAPTAIMLSAAIESGAKRARLVKYMTSGDSSGDYSSVVGYAGIVVY